MAYENFINENIAPYAATKIGVYDSEGNKVGVIPLGDFKPEYGNRLYRFGVLSDVHNQSDQSAESTADLQRALSIFNEKESVIMTCICGDISQNGTASEFEIYKNNVDTKSPNTPVYTTVGNHDATSSGLNLDNWNTYTGNHGRSFEVTQGNDHFLFFGMNYWSLGSSGTPYIEEDMAWLEEKLETYRNERCFIFTHLFFPDRAGNLNSIYPSGNWLGGAQLTRIQGLCDHYKNTIWFSGHSHWKWYLQKYQDKANIYRNDCGWCVHIPSCASPIDSNGTTRVSMPLESEGAIVDVYENYIDIRGIDLKNEKYLPIAQYRLDTTLVEIPAKDTPGEGQTGLTWNYNTKIDKNTGDISTGSAVNYCASDFIEVNEGDIIDITTTITGTSPNYEIKLCYYNDSQNFISCDTNALVKTDQSIFGGQSVIGSGIKYIRLRGYAAGTDAQHTLVNSLTFNKLNRTNSYSITNNLTNCTTSNSSPYVLKNGIYTAILTPDTRYILNTVTVTMGDIDITSTAYNSVTNVITINNVTGDIVITATCTERIVNVSYELAEETVFNGTDTYIDTGIDLLSADCIDKDWTMLVDFTSNSIDSDKAILHCMRESSPYPGLCLDFNSNGGLRAVVPNNNFITISSLDTNRHKIVITKSGNTFTVYNESMSQLGTNTPDTITTVRQTLLLGAYQTANGEKGRFFNGTIHKFKIAEGVMSREDCLAWMGTQSDPTVITGESTPLFKVNSACLNTEANTLTDSVAGINAVLAGAPTISDNQMVFTANDTFDFDISSLDLESKNTTFRIKFTPTTIDDRFRNIFMLGSDNTFNKSYTSYTAIDNTRIQFGKIDETSTPNRIADATVNNCVGENHINIPALIANTECEIIISIEHATHQLRVFKDGELIQNGRLSTIRTPLRLSNTESINRFIGKYSIIELYHGFMDNYVNLQ